MKVRVGNEKREGGGGGGGGKEKQRDRRAEIEDRGNKDEGKDNWKRT